MILSRTPLSLSFFGDEAGNESGQAGHVGLCAAITRYVDVECRGGADSIAGALRLTDFSRARTQAERDTDRLETARCRLNITRHVEARRYVDELSADTIGAYGPEQDAAFEVGLLHALHGLNGRRPGPRRLAYESMRLAAAQGSAWGTAHVTSAAGGIQRVDFLANGAFRTRRIEIAPERQRELNAHLLLLAVHPRPSDLRHAANAGLRPGLRLTGLADEAIRLLHGSENILAFGDLMQEAWRATFAQAGPSPFAAGRGLYAQARQMGAVGGSILGGGRLLLLCAAPDAHADIARALDGVTRLPFAFDPQGSRLLRFAPNADEAAPPLSRPSFAAPAYSAAVPLYAQAA